jgi:hypothetical protein
MNSNTDVDVVRHDDFPRFRRSEPDVHLQATPPDISSTTIADDPSPQAGTGSSTGYPPSHSGAPRSETLEAKYIPVYVLAAVAISAAIGVPIVVVHKNRTFEDFERRANAELADHALVDHDLDK